MSEIYRSLLGGYGKRLLRSVWSMTIRNLQFLFRPASIVLVGAGDPSAGGAALLHNLDDGGFKGEIFLIGRNGRTFQGKPTYRKLSRLPDAPELAIIATPPATVPALIAELGALGTKAAVVVTSFPTHDWPQQRQAMLEAARPHLLRLAGPACHAVLAPGWGINIGFSPVQPRPGPVAFVTQSAAIAMAVLDWAYPRGIGFSQVIALGAMMDVDFGDLLDYLTDDSDTQAILLYLETITQARKFMSAARAAARVKSVIVLKGGRQDNAVYDAAFRRAGMLRVHDLGELFGAVETLALNAPVYGDRLAIVGNGGGIAALIVDALEEATGSLAVPAPTTLEGVNALLPWPVAQGNPIDLQDDADADRYAAALGLLLADSGVDAVLVAHSPNARVSAEAIARAVIATVARYQVQGARKPCVFTSWLGDSSVQTARRLLCAQGIPSYDTPVEAVRAILNRVQYRRNQEMLLQTPPAVTTRFTPDPGTARQIVRQVLAEERTESSEIEAKALLAAYQLPVIPTRPAATPEEAARIAAEFGGPVALKILATHIRHKLDVAGVALELETPAVVRENARVMWERINKEYPEAEPLGFTVQPMVHRPQAYELRVGIRTDPLFGPVILFGQGGAAGAIAGDRAFALPPLNLQLAREVMARTRLYALLQANPAIAAVDLDAIALTLVKLSQLVIDLAEVVELDIDPLLADAQGVIALGTRIKVAGTMTPPSQRLAIRPYPQELEETIALPDGRNFLLRPVRPEDEPAFHAAFAKLSAEEIRMRFMHPVRGLTHATAARLTQIDYDREMALVLTRRAEDGSSEIYGVVRLVADPDKERAEFAIIVGSPLIGTGMGSLLMRRMIDYARKQGIKEIIGDVLRENRRMLKLAEVFGFVATPSLDDPGVVRVSLPLRSEQR
ncbi:MAG: bifunctional acetate--CoA ligase family protein/GNAT family N-acetyltransferase [Candidatus Competibacteraceae bacterium]